ncbi:hypothetical protein [Chryseobacterium sp. CT-SW4]|uniref:hypothetical protein n=1 Tax=Chryseobacterium sp. SW-1 TaxID=3157343 RepID=UPI003B01F547
MSNYKFVFVLMLSAVGFSQAQVRIVNSINNSAAPSSSAFIDASSNSTTNATTNVGKGLIFPRTDLTTFTTFSGTPTGIATSYPTRFDGMIVYNTATSGVAGVGSTQGTLTAGYWYYDNKSTTVNGGTWRPVSSATSSAVNILTTETVTNTLVNSAQVYAIKGTFTATGSSTAVDIPAPTGMTALYGITIYKAGTNTVYSRDLYSYTIATTAGNAITGSPTVSVVYPAGTYDYVLEYLK